MDILDRGKKILESMTFRTDEVLQIIAEAEKELENLSKNYTFLIDYKDSDRILDFSFTTMLIELDTRPQDILFHEWELAVLQTKEFNLPDFVNTLVKVVYELNPIILKRNGRNIEVKINMDSVAGNLKEYAQAVQKANRELGISGKTRGKKHKESGEDLASRIWAHKIYGVGRENKTVQRAIKKKGKIIGYKDVTKSYVGKYEATIRARIANFTKPAPWWKLVNDGNANVKLPGSKGGTPYPVFPATRFVQKSISAIKALAQSVFNDEYNVNYAQIEDQLAEISNNLFRIRQLIEDLTKLIGTPSENPAFKVSYNKLKEHLGRKVNLADNIKLTKLALELSQGVAVNPKNGIRLGRGVRIRTIVLARQIQVALQGK